MIYSNNLLKLMGTDIAQSLLTEDHYCAEQKLWRHVVLNAFEDVLVLNTDRKSSIFKLNAHQWIMTSPDFETVCWWAGWDPDDVRVKYLKGIKESKIKFYQKHILWFEYASVYNKLKKEKDSEKRKELYKLVNLARKAVFNATSVVVTEIFVS